MKEKEYVQVTDSCSGITGFSPLIANAGEITLLPSVKLQIGDRDDYGRYWDGGYWRDRDYWNRHYEWRGDRWWKHDNGSKPFIDQRGRIYQKW